MRHWVVQKLNHFLILFLLDWVNSWVRALLITSDRNLIRISLSQTGEFIDLQLKSNKDCSSGLGFKRNFELWMDRLSKRAFLFFLSLVIISLYWSFILLIPDGFLHAIGHKFCTHILPVWQPKGKRVSLSISSWKCSVEKLILIYFGLPF